MTNDERLKEILNEIDTTLRHVNEAKQRTVAPATHTLAHAQHQLDGTRETVFHALIQLRRLT